MIDTKINEILPQMIEEQMRQKVDSLSFNIQTTINGKSSADLKGIVMDELLKNF